MKKILIAVGLIVSATGASAAPTQWAGNGHYYEFVSTTNTWTGAKTAAEGMSFGGVAGHLATVTSQGEQDFLFGLSTARGWLGGSDAAAEGVWEWVVGPEAGTVFWNGGPGGSSPTYAAWNGSEPNNLGGEDYLVNNWGANTWNDLPNIGGYGYFVEYSTTAPVPVPAALPLLVSALGVAGWLGRRRRA